MYALIFTNTVLGAYLSYIVAEKRHRSVKEPAFWLILLFLVVSLAITGISLLPEELETVRENIVSFPL